MSDDVVRWVHDLARGDPRGAQAVFDCYFEQLVRVARHRLKAHLRRAADEEDVALSAMHSFCRGVIAGRFPQLDEPSDIRTLLLTITARKAAKEIRRATAQRRGRGSARGESAFLSLGKDSRLGGIGQVLGHEPTPEFAALMAESCQSLLDLLDDTTLQHVVLLKLEGYTNVDIASQLACAERTVERKLRRVRAIWQAATE